MKKILIILAALVPSLAMADHHNEKPEVKKEAATGAFRHVVILKFKEEATKEQIAKIEKEFAALETKIETVTGLEWGTNVSPEDRAQGYTHCFIVSFKDRAGLDVYAPHEAHQAFVKILRPVLDEVFVIDFVAQ
ncbi:Dabb family protein [Verrucomicrobiaceae bacterium 227]